MDWAALAVVVAISASLLLLSHAIEAAAAASTISRMRSASSFAVAGGCGSASEDFDADVLLLLPLATHRTLLAAGVAPNLPTRYTSFFAEPVGAEHEGVSLFTRDLAEIDVAALARLGCSYTHQHQRWRRTWRAACRAAKSGGSATRTANIDHESTSSAAPVSADSETHAMAFAALHDASAQASQKPSAMPGRPSACEAAAACAACTHPPPPMTAAASTESAAPAASSAPATATAGRCRPCRRSHSTSSLELKARSRRLMQRVRTDRASCGEAQQPFWLRPSSPPPLREAFARPPVSDDAADPELSSIDTVRTNPPTNPPPLPPRPLSAPYTALLRVPTPSNCLARAEE